MIRNPMLIAVPKSESPVTIVVQIMAVENEKPTCIICLDSGNDVMRNTRCSCIYHIHTHCFDILEPKKCPLCRKDIRQASHESAVTEDSCCCLVSIMLLIVIVILIFMAVAK